jgi:hypothetical protein
MNYSKRPPEGLPTERTLRSMIRTISKELQKDLAVQEKLALLAHQARLSKQLKQSAEAAARQD